MSNRKSNSKKPAAKAANPVRPTEQETLQSVREPETEQSEMVSEEPSVTEQEKTVSGEPLGVDQMEAVSEEEFEADPTETASGEDIEMDLTETGNQEDIESALETPAEAAPQAVPQPAGTTETKESAENTRERIRELEAQVEALRKSTEELKRKTEEEAKAASAEAKAALSRDRESLKEKISKRRSAEIFGVFAKHNFYANGVTPEELRTTLEDLGPTYVKIGQIMSSRVDILPESYCKELEKLRQNVQELDPRLARAVIEEQTGKRIDEIYSEFRDKPLGSASVGQAHYAVLKDGRQVVTKVRRPHIAEMMRQDFVLLKKFARAFNTVTEGAENAEDQVNLIEVIEEFEKVTEEELDFRTEARNTKFFKENCIEDEEKVTCPDVVDELTTECMFTMSFVDGYSISKKDRVIEDGYDPEEIGRNIVNNYVHQVLDVGVFHADPHQGNIMISHGKPVWIDFGMLGRITEGDVNIIQSLILAVLEKDAETIANSIMSMGAASTQTNRDRLIEDLDGFLDRYCSVTSISDLDVSILFDEICDLAAKHHVKMPGKFTMLIRSLGTIEGVIEQFCPELNLFEILSQKMMARAKKSFDLEQEILAIGKDALEISKKAAKIPAITSDVLKGLARGRTKINLELTGYEELLNIGGDSIKSIVLAIFACILFVGSCILCLADITPKAPGGMPVLAAVGLIFAVALAIYTVKNIGKK